MELFCSLNFLPLLQGVSVCSAILDDKLAVCIKIKMHIINDQTVPLFCIYPRVTFAQKQKQIWHEYSYSLSCHRKKKKKKERERERNNLDVDQQGKAKFKVFPYHGILCNS